MRLVFFEIFGRPRGSTLQVKTLKYWPINVFIIPLNRFVCKKFTLRYVKFFIIYK